MRLQPLDPGPGRKERLTWARAVGALQEMDFYLGRHSLLSRLKED
jgi:hypothetical protein